MSESIPEPLTAQQRVILDWLGAFVQQHNYRPSYQQVADSFGLRFRSTAQHHLGSLRQLGWIRWDSGRSQTLEFYHPDGTWHRTPPPRIK